MNTYRIGRRLGSSWVKYHFYKLEDPKYYEKRIIGLNKYTDDEPIYLEIDFLDEASDNEWAYQDYLEWNIGSPVAVCMVISERLKSLLYEQLNLPKHYLYPAEIWNPRTNETRKDYYVLHIVNNIFEEMDCDKSEFGAFDLGSLKLLNNQKVEKEVLVSHEAFDNYRSIFYTETEKMINPTKLVFKEGYNYDIFSIPVISLAVYISEKVRQLLIENNISGIDFIAHNKEDIWRTTPEIIMGNES